MHSESAKGNFSYTSSIRKVLIASEYRQCFNQGEVEVEDTRSYRSKSELLFFALARLLDRHFQFTILAKPLFDSDSDKRVSRGVSASAAQ